MTAKPKQNARLIRQYLATLKKQGWMGTARSWWPDHVFHVTDILNAVQILREGALLSRTEALARELMETDNASPQIISQTEDRWKDYVRLYLRPRTPTHYQSEGFRPADLRSYDAHCPVPVCLLFDSYSVLSRSDTQFTDGNLASSPNVYSEASDLQKIPFEYVYHDSRFEPEERDKIIFHRNAEVIVPGELDLGSLRFIGC